MQKLTEVSNNTSDAAQTDVQKELACLKSIPNDVRNYLCKTMYHVVFDCDFGNFYNQTLRAQYQSGKRIPIAYDKDDAVRIAQKLINIAVNEGSWGSGFEKKYPFLGAVVFGFDFTNYNDVKYTRGDNATMSSHDLIFYDVNEQGQKLSRGSLSSTILAKTILIDAMYVIREDISPENGFALLNLVSDLSVKDINILKCLYHEKEHDCLNIQESQIHTASKNSVQLGGFLTTEPAEKNSDDTNYYKHYIKEKALYLNEKSQNGNNTKITVPKSTNHVGGNDEPDYHNLYKQKKAEYLRLKSSTR